MAFDKKRDSIAITIPRFTLSKSSDLSKNAENEPYIVAAAIDGNNINSQQASFMRAVFPRMKPGDTADMIGHGHLVYGPCNPGEFVAFSVLVVESDSDLDDKFEKAFKQVNDDPTFKELMENAAGGARAALTGVDLALKVIRRFLEKNKDDELFRTGGTLLRDIEPAYCVDHEFKRGNEYVDITIKVIPLEGQ